jgi:phospholipid/cholesterol/gamma-HCH transport system permease protein
MRLSAQDISTINSDRWQLSFALSSEDQVMLTMAGNWRTADTLPPAELVIDKLHPLSGLKKISFNTENIAGWDSGLLSFFVKLNKLCQKKPLDVSMDGLSKNMLSLLTLANAVPERERNQIPATNLLVSIGQNTRKLYRSCEDMTEFVGLISISFYNFLRGHVKFLWSDFFYFIQDCSVKSLPIVIIITFLMGLILAFIGAVQLQAFGAGIYVANLVAVGMTREMSPLMIAIIMTGRTGASYAAQLGSMQVNEEIDALKTTVISPIDFLILPRILALVLMIPLLCVYGDFVGIVGGMIIGAQFLHISFSAYITQTVSSISLTDVIVGLVKSIIFGLLVAIAGCYEGLKCGRSSDAVGGATTQAVVTGILYVIVADAIFEIILNILNI